MTGPGADGLSVTVVTSRVELEECWRIRFAVFVDEQDVPAEMEVDDLDTAVTTTHVLATVAGSAVATARLLPVEPGVVRIGRVAVAREARGTG
ncbi:MAG: GNAT family N-acetyltransferase, partial [Actinomycetaceae bacterium]